MKPDDSCSPSLVLGRVETAFSTHIKISADVGQACGNCTAPCGDRQRDIKLNYCRDPKRVFREGQTVFLETCPRALAQISLSLYLFPILGFLLGACTAFALGLGDGMQAIVGLVFLSLSLALMRLFLMKRYGRTLPIKIAQAIDK